jgi:uncharacterized protein
MFTSQPLRLDWTQDLPKYWNDNSPFKTHYLNALSVAFTEGERFFIDSIKPYKNQINNPQQLKEFDEFVKQENWHRFVHSQYNNWVDTTGIPAKKAEQRMDNFWHRMRLRWSQRACLAATVCIEHITATNAELMLKLRTTFRKMHPHFEQVWRWHAIEEIEHKSVAIDIYNATVKSVWLRRLAMIVVLAYYTYHMSYNLISFLRSDKQLWRWQTLKDGWTMLFDKHNGVIRCSAPYMWDFMRADWHPNQTDHSILLKYSKV